MINNVLTSREAAKLYGLSPNTVTQWCNRGRFTNKEAKKSEKTWLVTKSGMERLTKKEELKMKVFYEDIEIGTVITNQSLTVDEALELIGFDEEKFCEEQGFDASEGLDPSEFSLVY